ncbi:MAG: hypothetical protein OEM89_10190 [Nitrosopumilus sp.]|jgi:hypothetical protein|nr:hypothetical protein [Nitrosopumilus sp.]
MSDNQFEKEKKGFTPERGFNLVGIDYFGDSDGQLYLIEHFDLYQDALKAKKNRRNPQEYLILYKGSGGEFLSH